jgi:hypothetical protein
MGSGLASSRIYVGVAGWSMPASSVDQFNLNGSHLQRYSSRLNAVEINSSFYRPHRRSTYERWAASVPDGFRFAVKLPKAITHEHRLRGCEALLERFAGEVAGLGEKRGPILVQLPPSLGFEPLAVQAFLAGARRVLGGAIVLEPRHASWFSAEVDAILASEQVARVVADPAVTPAGLEPGGWRRPIGPTIQPPRSRAMPVWCIVCRQQPMESGRSSIIPRLDVRPPMRSLFRPIWRGCRLRRPPDCSNGRMRKRARRMPSPPGLAARVWDPGRLCVRPP